MSEEIGVLVHLYDAEENITYTINVSQENAEKCENDFQFANMLLQKAKTTETETVMKESSDLKTKFTENSWNVEDTIALITAYENFSDQLSHAKKRKYVWELISNELISLGIHKTADKCEMKWRNLIRTYKAVKDNKKSTGRGPIRFQFYDKIDEILGDKPSISCKHTIDTSNIPGTNETSEKKANSDEIGSFQDSSLSEDLEKNASVELPKKKPKCSPAKELLNLKIRYFKNKEENLQDKEKRKTERLQFQRKLIELEERKVDLLEKLVKK